MAICSGSNDVDVVYFDAADARAERDAELELRLLAAYPHVRWDVKNQARMHLHNGEAPYLNTEGAMARWPETATAVAVRRRLGRVELIAPHGVGDLLNLIVRPTPAFRSRSELVARRIEEKGWRLRWPQLAMAGFEGE